MNPLPRMAIPLAALLGLTAFVYWPGLNGPLILDDVSNLDILRRLSEQGRLSLGNVLEERGGVLGGRPVSWVLFVLNWHISGGDVWAFKLVNLLIHLLNGTLVLVLAKCLLGAAGIADSSTRGWLALAVCGFWLLTPLQVSSVLYLVQRMTLLAAFFSLAGLAAYCLARETFADRPRLRVALMAMSIVVFWPLAALSKQNGALLLLLLLVLELLVFQPRHAWIWPGRVLLLLSGLLVSAGIVRFAIDPQWVLDTYPLRDFTLEQRLLTQPRILLDYVLNILQLPGGSALGLFHDDFPVSTSLLAPWSTLPAMLFWLAMVPVAWFSRGRAVGLVSAGLVFFLAGHSLEAGPFALEMYFEHRNYLPSAGVWLSVVVASALALERMAHKRLFAWFLALVFAGHAGLTAARVAVWQSFDEIVETNAVTHPRSSRARAGAAIVAFTEGALDRGLDHLHAVRTILGPSAELPVVLKSLVGFCLANREPAADLTARLRSSNLLVIDPYTVAALRWYRTVSTTRECPGLDTGEVSRKLLKLAGRNVDPRRYGLHWSFYDQLAGVVESVGQIEIARRLLRQAVISAPSSVRPELDARLEALSGR